MELAVPIRVVEIPAKALANLIASIIDCSSQRAAANAPEKASPAPEVSITLILILKLVQNVFRYHFERKLPDLQCDNKFLTPKSKEFFSSIFQHHLYLQYFLKHKN